MKKVRKGILFVLGLGFTVLWFDSIESAPRIYAPFKCEIEPVSYDASSGHVVLELELGWDTLWGVRPLCNDVMTLRVKEVDGLVYSGPQEWDVVVHPEDEPVKSRIEVVVPANDTSGIRIITSCSTASFEWPRYLITSGDSIKGVWSDPRHWIPLGAPASVEEQNRAMAEELKRLWEEKQSQEKPDPQSAMKITTRRAIEPIKPCDSALFDSLSDLGQRRLLSMRARERDAYEGSDRQLYEVEGRWWVRERGEREFRRLEPQTDEELREEARQLWDSLGTKSPDDSCTAYVYVESPEDEAFARSLIDSLSPTDLPGVYRVHTTHRVLDKLRAQGIRYRFNLRRLRERRDSTTTPSEED